MPIPSDKKHNLEILISTTKKNNLDFVENIFFENNKHSFPIIIVNQSGKISDSEKKNIKVINTDTKGLSESRNLAIKYSSKKYCLLADDDIIYKDGFYKIIEEAFEENLNSDVITFMMVDENGKKFKKYPNSIMHDFKSIRDVNSVVIAFKRESIIKNNIQFDTLFGLGAIFETGEEYIFLRNCIEKNLTILFCPKIILQHKSISSGKLAFKDKNIFARAAIFYKFYGYLSYLKLVHHIYLLKKRNMISWKQVFNKFLVGLDGIKKYKSI
jgi:glycosyltransferase involved in cell wall biosynthesis